MSRSPETVSGALVWSVRSIPSARATHYQVQQSLGGLFLFGWRAAWIDSFLQQNLSEPLQNHNMCNCHVKVLISTTYDEIAAVSANW